MKKFSIFCLSLLAAAFFLSGCVMEQQAALKDDAQQVKNNNPKLPFAISVGGSAVQLTDSGKAVVNAPVASDAEIVCDIQNKDIISISFFPCDSNGIAVPGKKPEIIIIRDGNKTLISDTIDKKPLTPGFYLMNVSADNKTVEAVIQIKK